MNNMGRRQRNNFDDKDSGNSTVYLVVGIIVAVILAFIIAYSLYSNRLSKQSKMTNVQKVSNAEKSNAMLNLISNEESSETSTSIGKSVNEVENKENSKNSQSNTEKRAVNTSTIEKNTTTNKNDSGTNNSQTTQTATSDPTFVKPVDGDVIKDYSSDNLLYSNTLEEWTTHLGIDFAAEKTSIVKASADGTVKSIKNDPRYGLTLVIEHSNGFTSMYSSLLSTEFVTVGETVTQGQTIATVGNTATFEIADETHLHFEILKDGVNVDPNLYLK